jgi:hypothetical protein
MQREFVADVSHELRTPLTTVHGNLALLRHDPPLPVDEQAISDRPDGESDRLIRLVNNAMRRGCRTEPVYRSRTGASVIDETYRQSTNWTGAKSPKLCPTWRRSAPGCGNPAHPADIQAFARRSPSWGGAGGQSGM